MAYSTGGGQHRHDDEAPNKSRVASQGSGYGGGAAQLETQENGSQGGGGGDDAIGGDAPNGGSQIVTNGVPHGAYGPGDSHDGPGSSGFMPNGEDGLMMLADYAQTQGWSGANSNNNSDNTPGNPPGGFGAPGGDAPGGAPGGGEGTAPVASSDGGPGGFGLGGGGGGGSSGGVGGDPGGIGAGIPPGGGSPGGGSPGGGPTSPGGGLGGGGDGGGGKVCVVSALDTCGQSPVDGGPPITLPPASQALGGPRGPSDDGPSNNSPLPGGGAVPEPATWLMMILGFGAAGSAVREQRRQAREARA